MNASIQKEKAWKMVPGRSAPVPTDAWRGRCAEHDPAWLGIPHFIGYCAMPYFEALLDATTHDLKYHAEEIERDEVVKP